MHEGATFRPSAQEMMQGERRVITAPTHISEGRHELACVQRGVRM